MLYFGHRLNVPGMNFISLYFPRFRVFLLHNSQNFPKLKPLLNWIIQVPVTQGYNGKFGNWLFNIGHSKYV